MARIVFGIDICDSEELFFHIGGTVQLHGVVRNLRSLHIKSIADRLTHVVSSIVN